MLDFVFFSAPINSLETYFRNAAERELKRNDYRFEDVALPVIETRRGRFKPYELAKPGQDGLTKEEMESMGASRDVTYAGGIMMVAGQRKGFMLRSLLARTSRRFKTIIFVDDSSKNIGNMIDGFRGKDEKLIAFRYSREDGNVKRFEKSNKRHVVDGWNRIRRAVRFSLIQD